MSIPDMESKTKVENDVIFKILGFVNLKKR